MEMEISFDENVEMRFCRGGHVVDGASLLHVVVSGGALRLDVQAA